MNKSCHPEQYQLNMAGYTRARIQLENAGHHWWMSSSHYLVPLKLSLLCLLFAWNLLQSTMYQSSTLSVTYEWNWFVSKNVILTESYTGVLWLQTWKTLAWPCHGPLVQITIGRLQCDLFEQVRDDQLKPLIYLNMAGERMQKVESSNQKGKKECKNDNNRIHARELNKMTLEI